MRFVDSLRQPGDNERIEATCNYYITSIISGIHSLATNASRFKQNRIEGYLGYLLGSELVMRTIDQLGHKVGHDNDPKDFKWVFSDLECTFFNSNDTVYLTKEIIDKRVLPHVKKQLIEDGFRIIALRCDSAQEYVYETRYFLFVSHQEKAYTGKYGLFIFVDIAW